MQTITTNTGKKQKIKNKSPAPNLFSQESIPNMI